MNRDYEQLAWVDYPEELTPLNAANLNRIESGIAGLYTDRNNMESNMAYVEDEDLSTRAYDAYTYLMHNGMFYKVVRPIEIGDLLDPGINGNITRVNVSSQFASSGGSDIDMIFGDFATVEYIETASKNYSVGDYLVYNRRFYKVTAPISQGDLIIPDGNVVQTTVGDEVSTLISFERREKAFVGPVASGGSITVTMDLSKSGYIGIPGYSFTVTNCVVVNIFNQDHPNDASVTLRNLGTTSITNGTVYVNMIYIKA